ncbi:hypothetical protein BRADI_1g22887v3 [Brachypodium distachyon]|uniref:Uncharacterized protein n=1 Tax=Brachypodium distachyon TaxID=15368 RepID=A0A2K2DKN9_BRADI|nr:hypothetical protein BRADI_1g22887v3 [Brachypodium distachyon]
MSSAPYHASLDFSTAKMPLDNAQCTPVGPQDKRQRWFAFGDIAWEGQHEASIDLLAISVGEATRSSQKKKKRCSARS